MSEKISSDELIYITKFTAIELDKAIKSLELLIKQKGFVDPALNRDIITNTSEIIMYLPNVKHLYLKESIASLKRICLLIAQFVKVYPEHQFNNIFLQVLDAISQYFNTFSVSEDLSHTPQESNEDRSLNLRVLNPNADKSREFKQMIKGMVKSSGPQYESDDNWLALATGVLATYEGAVDAKPPREAIDELMLSSANRLHQREEELKASKVKITQQLSELTLTDKEEKKKKRENLLNNAANGIIISNSS
jgi:hypothetical protein